MNPEYLKKYDTKYLCYSTIKELFRDRKNQSSSLKINGHIQLTHVHITGDKPNYLFDLSDLVEKQISQPEGFAPVMTYIDSLDRTIKDLSKATKIHRVKLHQWKNQGREILYNFVKHNRYD